MRWYRLVVVVLAVGVVAAACGGDDDSGQDAERSDADAAPTSTVEGDDDLFAGVDGTGNADAGAAGEPGVGADDDLCAGISLEATEIGVTADTITVLVMADVGSELAPGLFQGSIDGTRAWAEKVNDDGGLACRRVEVVEWDSALNATESTNGFLEACDTALAMVGSNSLFVTDIAALESCPDAEGEPTGIADIAALAVSSIHQCSPNVFPAGPVSGSCPYSGEGPRDYTNLMGPMQWILDNELGGGPVEGIYLIPSDLPTTIAASMPIVRSLNQIGVDTTDGEFGVSGRAEQATFGSFIQNMLDRGVTWAYNGSNDQAMLKLRQEAVAQGFDDASVQWVCSLSCYTPAYIEQGGAAVEGTWLSMQFLPFEEADSNEELARFLDYYGDDFPPSWAANAWASGLLFEQAVDAIVERDGPNALTRRALLDQLAETEQFDANGWYGTIDYTADTRISNCYVLVQVRDGDYVRIHPDQPGTFDCDPGSVIRLDGLDAAAEYRG